MELMHRNIFRPGDLIVVNDDVKDSSYGTGSLGFVSYMTYAPNKFLSTICVEVIRRGKSGKHRLDSETWFTPIFFEKHHSFTQHCPVSENKNTMGRFVHVEKVNMSKNLMAWTDMEFIGWCSAYGVYLNTIAKYSNYHTSIWPEDKSHLLHKVLNMRNSWNNDPEGTMHHYASNTNVRNEILIQIRQKEASLTWCDKLYQYSMFSLMDTALALLVKHDSYGWIKNNLKLYNDTKDWVDSNKAHSSQTKLSVKVPSPKKKQTVAEAINSGTIYEATPSPVDNYNSLIGFISNQTNSTVELPHTLEISLDSDSEPEHDDYDGEWDDLTSDFSYDPSNT